MTTAWRSTIIRVPLMLLERMAQRPRAATGVILAVAALLLAGASPQAARIDSITPSSATRGELVTITGIGFGAGSVRITVGGVAAEVLTATGHSATFRVPFGVRRGVTTVAATNPGGHTGSIAFQVLNRAPQAHAGPDQTVFVTSTAQLDGAASTDADGDELTFHWSFLSRPDGSNAVLTDASAARPTFFVDLPGRYTVQLIVNDGFADSEPDTVLIDTHNSPPVANAGPDQTVFAGATVQLDGSASSDVDHDLLRFTWSFVSRPAGSNATLTDPTGPGPAFIVDLPGQYIVQLVVNDGTDDSRPDAVTVDTQNSRPLADAGPDQTVTLGQAVQLDGSQSSDVDGDVLSFRWSLVSRPAGSATALSDVTAVSPTFVADAIGIYVVQLIVNDGTTDSQPDTAVVTVNPANRAPDVNAGTDQTITLPNTAALSGSVTDDGLPPGSVLTIGWSKVSGSGSVTFGNASAAQTTAAFSEAGVYVLRLMASDGALSSSDDVRVTVNPANQAPSVDAGPDQTVTLPNTATLTGTVTDDGLPAGATLTIAWTVVSGPGTVTFSNPNGTSTVATFSASGEYVLRLTANDSLLSSSDDVTVTVNPAGGGGGLPPDPSTVAPPVDRAVATGVGKGTEFLYTGANPIQTGVAPGTIEAKRAAVVRGRVMTRDGAPLGGVTTTILGHPEFGQTLSRADGMFDMAVNGGGLLTVRYEKLSFLPAQRQINVPWQDYAMLDDVVLVALDPQVTAIDLNAATPIQVARGNPVTDADGTRQATLLFRQGTTATMTLPDGSTQPLTTLSVRATEYTVGPDGPKAMPGVLPPTSGYTYAVEFSSDEAMAAGAREVRFSQPVIHYVENYLGFPVGGIVPVGFYDREKAAWVASDNGRVIKILSITGGLAALDTDGDSVADDGASLGITDAERQQLASLYLPGQSLWRVPITHFTPWDHNWPYGVIRGSRGPNVPDPKLKILGDPCEGSGSIIECHNQTLGEVVAVTGTPYRLSYRSDRVPGRKDAYTLDIPLIGADVPASLKRITLEILVAGQRFTQSFGASPNRTHAFTWDGKDAYGRTLQGVQTAIIRIGYVYDSAYLEPAPFLRSFGLASPVVFVFVSNIQREFTFSQEIRARIGGWDARGQGLGGWTLNVHHAYDPTGRVLLLGDGRRGSGGESVGRVITIARRINAHQSIAASPDGSLFIADVGRIFRLAPDGVLSTVAGTGISGFSGDGGPATQAQLDFSLAVALGPDGSLYIGEPGRVRRVGLDGIIRTVAGTGLPAGCCAHPSTGDGGPATEAQFVARDIAVGPDGSIYIAEGSNSRVRRVGPDGIITTVAGTGAFGSGGDGGPATQAQLFAGSVAIGPDGSLYIGDDGKVRRVGADGIISTVAGNGNFDRFLGEGGPATLADVRPVRLTVGADGSLYISDEGFTGAGRVRRVGADGIITTVAGGEIFEFREGGPATLTWLSSNSGIALSPDGHLYIGAADGNGGLLWRVSPPLPGFGGGDLAIPSEAGGELYQFDAAGRHLRTVNALTGSNTYSFGYDREGRLALVTDANGNATTIERDGAGNPIAIGAPGGQQTSLAVDASGFLARVTNPAGDAVQLASTADGLLSSLTDARGGLHRFTYDAQGQGRLTRDEDPAGGIITLTRVETANGFMVTRSTALGRTSTYEVERLSTGEVRRINSSPGGARTEVLTRADGTQTAIFPDGTRVTAQRGPDPRFGMQAPVLRTRTHVAPDGQTETVLGQRSVSLADPADPLSLVTLTDTVTVNGRASSRSYNAALRRVTTTSAEGREISTALDAQGRVIFQELAPGVEPIFVTYDAIGRVSQQAQGSQSWTFTYDAKNRVIARTDAAGSRTQYAYDTNDRVTQMILPGGGVYGFAYDASGNRTRVTMPSGAVHALDYTAVNLGAAYTPPGNGSYVRSYNVDRAVTRITLPGGRAADTSYDSAGRPTGMSYAEAVTVFDYLPGDLTDRAGRITRTPVGGGAAQALAFSYNGPQVTAATWTGAAQGQFTYTYDNNFFLTGMHLVSGADTVQTTLARDRDGNLTAYGPFTLTRDGPGGAPSSIADGALNLVLAYDTLARPAARAHTVSGQQAYQVQLTYDNLGRVVQRVETLAGAPRVDDYAYDADGQLIEVRRGGGVIERYTYDVNGNRTSRQVGTSLAEAATYDAQDRLTQRGAITYHFNADGFLAQRGGDTFEYSARGELFRATVGSQTIAYSYDGLGRRVSRTDSAGTSQYLYGDPGNAFRITAVRDPAGLLATLFYDGAGNLFAIERGGVRVYVATDQVATPRVVTDAGGAVIKVLEHDSFGVLTADSNPGFELPIGFAGGLADAATGLIRFGLRDYDPRAGRWTARDPFLFRGGQGNLYAYTRNDPINNRDPSGLFAICIGASLYGGAGIGVETCIGPDGTSICVETGFGVGAGAGVSFGDVAETGTEVGVEASANCGPAGGGFNLSLDSNGCVNGTPSGQIGPVTFSPDGVGLEAETENAPEIKVGKCSAGAKVYGKVCKRTNF